MSRQTKRTRARDKRFFEALEQGATIGEAAKNAGYNRRSIYHYSENDPTFAQQLEDAKADLIEKLEKEGVNESGCCMGIVRHRRRCEASSPKIIKNYEP
ncbi:hypothetical protein P3580_24720 [Vibrio parahaemolyticus]|nr:hypothetical protein [Vibrio parahaemolyticus]